MHLSFQHQFISRCQHVELAVIDMTVMLQLDIVTYRRRLSQDVAASEFFTVVTCAFFLETCLNAVGKSLEMAVAFIDVPAFLQSYALLPQSRCHSLRSACMSVVNICLSSFFFSMFDRQKLWTAVADLALRSFSTERCRR